MALIKRRKRERRKTEPYAGSTIVGMKVACEEKAMRGWKQPPTIEEPLKSGKTPLGKEKGYEKGKDTEEKE